MKQLTTILTVFLLMYANVMAGNGIRKTQLAGVISEFRNCEGVELVKLGSLATSALKTTIRLSAKDDPDAGEALELFKGIKRFTVFEYEDSSDSVKQKINRRLDNVFGSSDLLMEVKDGDDVMKMYGVLNEKTGTVGDFVLYEALDKIIKEYD